MGSNDNREKNDTGNEALKEVAKRAISASQKSTSGLRKKLLIQLMIKLGPILGVLLAVQMAVTLPFLAINMIGANWDANAQTTITNEQAEQEAAEYLGKSVKSAWKKAKNEAKKAMNFLFGTNMSVGVNDENFVSGVDEQKVYEILEGAEDYESSMNAIARVMDLYLQDALDHRRNELGSHTGVGQIATYKGETINLESVDYDLTLTQFNAQGNPFTNTNYAALIAAYATCDYTINSKTQLPASNVHALIQALKNGEPQMLQVEYVYLDENGEQLSEEEVEPVPVYNYENVEISVDKDHYIEYLKLQEEQDPKSIVKNAVLKVLKYKNKVNKENSDDAAEQISEAQAKVQENNNKISANSASINAKTGEIARLQSQIDKLKEKKESAKTEKGQNKIQSQIDAKQSVIRTKTKEINALTVENTSLRTENASLESDINNLTEAKKTYDANVADATEKIKGIENGDLIASTDFIEKEYLKSDSYTVTVLKMKRNSDGKPNTKNIRYIKSKEGENAPDYVELSKSFGKDGYGKNLYLETGSSVQYPEITVKYYAKVVLKPYKSTDVFDIFNIDKNAVYAPSDVTIDGKITNEERYNQYYDTIAEQCESLRGATYMSSSLAHASSLTTDEIQGYLDAMPAGTSGNRKQFIKNLLYLVGAVPYDFGGDPSGPGWNDEWWTPKSDGSYKGLDCSSYVQWGVWTTFGSRLDAFNSTRTIFDTCQIIAEDQLQPGDLVLQQGVHVAVFLGYADGKKLYVHLGGGASGTEPPEVTTNAFSKNATLIYCRMTVLSNLEGSELYSDDITPFGIAAGDDLYIITKTLNGECGDGGDGFLAVTEACHNHAKASNLSMLEQVSYGNGSYLEAYKRIFVKGETYAKEPTAADYAMVQQVLSGKRVIFPGQDNVMYWRAHGYNPGSNYQFVKTVGGNDFYCAK